MDSPEAAPGQIVSDGVVRRSGRLPDGVTPVDPVVGALSARLTAAPLVLPEGGLAPLLDLGPPVEGAPVEHVEDAGGGLLAERAAGVHDAAEEVGDGLTHAAHRTLAAVLLVGERPE